MKVTIVEKGKDDNTKTQRRAITPFGINVKMSTVILINRSLRKKSVNTRNGTIHP